MQPAVAMLLPLLLLQSSSGSNVAAAGFDTRPVQHCAFGGELPMLLVPNRDAAVVPLDRHYPAARLSHVCGCVVLDVVVMVFAVFAIVVFAVVVAAVVAPSPIPNQAIPTASGAVGAGSDGLL